MSRDTLINRLNQAIDDLIRGGARGGERQLDAWSDDSELLSLAAVAADLCDLPSEGFRARLRQELIAAANAPTYTDLAVDSEPAEKEGGIEPVSSIATPAREFRRVTPQLCCRNAGSALEFYKKVFGATEVMRFEEPDGRIGHAEIVIGKTLIMLGDEYPEYGVVGPESLGGSPVALHLDVEDVDAVVAQAVAAGAKIVFPVADQFYGARSGRIADPFGHVWTISTHKENVSDEEMHRRYEALRQAESAKAVSPIPKGFSSITPYLQVENARTLIDFVKRAFDAEEVGLYADPAGGVMHAEFRIGNSMIELADAGGQYKAMPGAMHLYVEDVDATYARAVEAGGISLHAVTDQPYGDREASVQDPVGNHWYIATHKLTGKPIPEGLRSITPYLHPQGADKMLDFLTRAFGAEDAGSHRAPDGTIAHAKVKIGDAIIEMGEAHGQWGPMPTAIHLYVPDSDAVYRKALEAGATSFFEPRDEPYGDRVGGVTDPFENVWYIATHKKA
jgi:PhnB protein